MKIISLCLIFCFIYSCTQEIEIDLPKNEPQLVVNCLFTPFTFPYPQPFEVYVSKSLDILDTNKNIIVTDAVVEIYTNDTLIEIIPFDDSLEYYRSLTLFPKINKEYEIRVIHNNTIITSKDVVPNPVLIEDISIIPIASRNETNDVYSEVSITFTDPPNENNYYEIIISSSFTQNDYEIYSNDPFITSEYYYPSILSMYNNFPKSLPFNDIYFNGNQVTAKVNYSPPVSTNKDSVLIHFLNVKLNSISENYYKYKTSKIKQLYNKERDILYGQNEPFNVYSNIQNGYGIFAGYYYEVKTIKIDVDSLDSIYKLSQPEQ